MFDTTIMFVNCSQMAMGGRTVTEKVNIPRVVKDHSANEEGISYVSSIL